MDLYNQIVLPGANAVPNNASEVRGEDDEDVMAGRTTHGPLFYRNRRTGAMVPVIPRQGRQ